MVMIIVWIIIGILAILGTFLGFWGISSGIKTKKDEIEDKN